MDEVWGADLPFKADLESNIYCINMFVSINMHAAEDAVPFTNISILESHLEHFGHVPSGSLRQCGCGGSPILIHFIGGNVPCFSIPH